MTAVAFAVAHSVTTGGKAVGQRQDQVQAQGPETGCSSAADEARAADLERDFAGAVVGLVSAMRRVPGVVVVAVASSGAVAAAGLAAAARAGAVVADADSSVVVGAAARLAQESRSESAKTGPSTESAESGAPRFEAVSAPDQAEVAERGDRGE